MMPTAWRKSCWTPVLSWFWKCSIINTWSEHAGGRFILRHYSKKNPECDSGHCCLCSYWVFLSGYLALWACPRERFSRDFFQNKGCFCITRQQCENVLSNRDGTHTEGLQNYFPSPKCPKKSEQNRILRELSRTICKLNLQYFSKKRQNRHSKKRQNLDKK